MRFILALILILTIGAAMSLHDVDKTNSNRITPILNSADDVQQRMAQGTNGVQNTNDLEEVDGLQFRERQIVAVQDGENKAAFGFYGSANKFGLKVAQDGYDVLTAADSELIFNSENNVFKIVVTGVATATKSASSTGGVTTVRHGLGYAPVALVFWYDGISNYPIPYGSFSSTGASAGLLKRNITFEVDETNLYILVTAPDWAGNTEYTNSFSQPMKYYLLQETAN